MNEQEQARYDELFAAFCRSAGDFADFLATLHARAAEDAAAEGVGATFEPDSRETVGEAVADVVHAVTLLGAFATGAAADAPSTHVVLAPWEQYL